MGLKFNNSELCENTEVNFDFDGFSFSWFGDYGVNNYGEHPTRSDDGWHERSVDIINTRSFLQLLDSGDTITMELTPVLFQALVSTLQNKHFGW